MKLKLTLENDRGINVGSVELKPRGVFLDLDSCSRLVSMDSGTREEPLNLIARNIGRSVGTEEIFQLCRAAVLDPTIKSVGRV